MDHVAFKNEPLSCSGCGHTLLVDAKASAKNPGAWRRVVYCNQLSCQFHNTRYVVSEGVRLEELQEPKG